jgi:hypothetical protein
MGLARSEAAPHILGCVRLSRTRSGCYAAIDLTPRAVN